MKMDRRTVFALATGLMIAGGVTAAEAQPASTAARLRGTIDSITGNTIELTLRNNTKTTAELPPNLRVTWLTEAQPSDIQKGSYIGTAAVPQPDGSLRALEVQVFPPAMRGVGQGTHPWDTGAGSSMTNGTVGSLVNANGRTITITYDGGEKKVFVPNDVPIVTYAPADRSVLAPGQHVIINGTRAADGNVTASSISVGKDGLVPPM
jgi:hypothetical protein